MFPLKKAKLMFHMFPQKAPKRDVHRKETRRKREFVLAEDVIAFNACVSACQASWQVCLSLRAEMLARLRGTAPWAKGGRQMLWWSKPLNGIPFWLVGALTAHFRTYLSGWIGMFTGGTIWILTHGQTTPECHQRNEIRKMHACIIPPGRARHTGPLLCENGWLNAECLNTSSEWIQKIAVGSLHLRRVGGGETSRGHLLQCLHRRMSEGHTMALGPAPAAGENSSEEVHTFDSHAQFLAADLPCRPAFQIRLTRSACRAPLCNFEARDVTRRTWRRSFWNQWRSPCSLPSSRCKRPGVGFVGAESFRVRVPRVPFLGDGRWRSQALR